MAAVQILLSPSPPRLAGRQVATMSSSPVFPSPGDLVRERSQSKPGNGAAPNPTLTTATFATSAGPHGERQSSRATAATEDPIADKSTKPKSSRKSKAADKAVDVDELAVKKPRKARAKKVDKDAEDPALTAEKPSRKPRAKKDATETQSKIPRGRVTKASNGSRAEKAVGSKKTAVVSRHFPSALADSADPFEISNVSKNDLLLQEAVKRRESWTPPKANAGPLDMTITPTEKDSGTPSLFDEKQKTLTDHFGKFNYTGEEKRPVPRQGIVQSGTKKRKLIELVSKNTTAPLTPLTKPKAVKKRPRTITELATSVYALNTDEDEVELPPAPLLQYLSHDKAALGEKMPGTIDAFKVPPKPHSKSPEKASSKASKAKNGTIQASILLSPQTALKQVEKQDFVFGTSSQLAREDSPTLLRDLQQAMQASNQIEDDSFANITGELSPLRSASTTERGTGLYMAKRNLWAAAAKGVEGGLKNIETIDMSESPQIQASLKPSVSAAQQLDLRSGSGSISVDEEWHDLDPVETSVKENSHLDKPVSSKVGSAKTAVPLGLPGSTVDGKEKRKPPPLKENIPISQSHTKSDAPSQETGGPQKPDYGSYPTARLAKEIASYHFKPVKGRDQMISLLERCWEGRQKVAASNAEKAKEVVMPVLNNKPLVLRQTPKKQKKASQLPEEIDDSDSPLTPSPPRRRTKARTPPLPLRRSVSEDPDESLVLSPTSQQLRLHEHISRAIRTAPPSKDPKKPSWYEKILLYDPIILEDLATWLNTGALEKVGWDGEVDAKEVKRWCMQKSICCLWRENLRGATRSRY